MAKNNGWFKMPRTLIECDLWMSDTPFNLRDAYVDLLMMSNYEERNFFPHHSQDVVVVHEGELATSIENLSIRWGWSKKKTINYLDRLEKAGMLSRKSYNWGTVIRLAGHGILGNECTANDTANAPQTTPQREGRLTPQTHQKRHTTKEYKNTDKGNKGERNKEGAKHLGVFSWEDEPE